MNPSHNTNSSTAAAGKDDLGIPPAAFSRHAEARAGLRQAEEALNSAIAGLKSAAAIYCRAEADIDAEDSIRRLSDIAWSNKTEWSGGCTNPSNIVETIMRAEDVEQLRQRVAR